MKMRSFREVYEEIGVSRTTLQGWVNDILEKPTVQDTNGWFFDDDDLKKIWKIHFFKQLNYDNKTIKAMLNDPDFNIKESLNKKIDYLARQKEDLETLISATRLIKETGASPDVVYLAFNQLNNIERADLYHNVIKIFGTIFNIMENDAEYPDCIEEYFVKDELVISFKAADKIMYLRGQGLDAHSKGVQDQVALIPEALICALWYLPNSEIATGIDKNYGKGSYIYFYNAFLYRRNLNGNMEWETALKNIMELFIKKYDADSETVQMEVAKLYQLFKIFSKKRRIGIFRKLSKIYSSNTYTNILNNKKPQGTFKFVSTAISIYCDKLENDL